MTMIVNAFGVLIPKFCILFMPPQCLGTAMGLQMAGLGLSQLVVTPGVKAFCNAMFTGGVARFRAAFAVLGGYSVLAGVAMYVFYAVMVLPQAGSITLASVRRRQAGGRRGWQA